MSDDFFIKLPSVARELIFRKSLIIDQRNIFRAYRDTPGTDVFNEIKKFQQKFSCWICQFRIWCERFMPIMVGFNTDGEGGFEYSALRCEPAHDTVAFNFLYKHKEKNHLKDAEVYTRRDFTTKDAEGADKIFREFLDAIDDVFKAENEKELLDHIHFAHPEDTHFPESFYDVFTKYQGEEINTKLFYEILTQQQIIFSAFLLTKPTETESQRREIQRLTEHTQRSYKFVAYQISGANMRMLRKMNTIWQMGGSVETQPGYRGAESMLTFHAYFQALLIEHRKIENEVSDTFPERKYSAC